MYFTANKYNTIFDAPYVTSESEMQEKNSQSQSYPTSWRYIPESMMLNKYIHTHTHIYWYWFLFPIVLYVLGTCRAFYPFWVDELIPRIDLREGIHSLDSSFVVLLVGA